MIKLNNIYNEDCLEGMKRIPDKSIDMILCDLPYGTTGYKWDSAIKLDDLWLEYKRIIKNSGAIVLTATQPFSSALLVSNINFYKHSWYWNKVNGSNPMTAKYKPMPVVEEVLVFSYGKVSYKPIMVEAERKNMRSRKGKYKANDSIVGDVGSFRSSNYHDEKKRYPKNLLTFNNRVGELNNAKRIHPTQKPVELFEYLIRTYTEEGETILDNCMGSGTTAIAAINTNRNYIGFELDKEYYEIAQERITKSKE